jgi:hypothetical protein
MKRNLSSGRLEPPEKFDPETVKQPIKVFSRYPIGLSKRRDHKIARDTDFVSER